MNGFLWLTGLLVWVAVLLALAAFLALLAREAAISARFAYRLLKYAPKLRGPPGFWGRVWRVGDVLRFIWMDMWYPRDRLIIHPRAGCGGLAVYRRGPAEQDEIDEPEQPAH